MQLLTILILTFLSVSLFAFNEGPILPKVMKKAERKYSGKVVSRFLAYNKLLKDAEHVSVRNKLQMVNNFFNQVPFKSDKEVWKQEDYWATPLEFLARGKGDSEDYVIAKFFALKTLGVDTKKLFFTYVQSSELNSAHMVLSYFEAPGDEPFVLDNLNPDILPASSRSDLSPVYNFNPSSNSTKDSDSLQESTHKKWEKLHKRVQRNKL